MGTNDTGATESDPTGGGATGNNMVQVSQNQFDGGADGGDNNLTQATAYVDGSTTRVTTFVYDWRNRRVDTDGEIDFFQRVTFDNLDRVVKGERYNTTSGGNLIGAVRNRSTTTGGGCIRRCGTRWIRGRGAWGTP